MMEEDLEVNTSDKDWNMLDSSSDEEDLSEEAYLVRRQQLETKLHDMLHPLREPLPSLSQCSTKSGFLFKQRRFSPTSWKKKYVIFRRNEDGKAAIYYYKSIQDAEVYT
jgi:hypothetical protein